MIVTANRQRKLETVMQVSRGSGECIVSESGTCAGDAPCGPDVSRCECRGSLPESRHAMASSVHPKHRAPQGQQVHEIVPLPTHTLVAGQSQLVQIAHTYLAVNGAS